MLDAEKFTDLYLTTKMKCVNGFEKLKGRS